MYGHQSAYISCVTIIHYDSKERKQRKCETHTTHTYTMETSKPITLPPSEDKLRLLIANGAQDVAQQLIDSWSLKYRIENGELKDALEGTELWLKRFITEDPDTLKMKDDARKLAKCDNEVLITGETGTGKELIARCMIANRTGKFIAVNCAGLPETLIESELFGYVKGSFTGADNSRIGLMAAAKDGVLFLDEIGELPLSVQAKLLRALQDKVVRRVGGKEEEEISCKFVCATHRNIKAMVDHEQFRQDLYARVSTLELDIKPLRERERDIVPLLMSMPGGKQLIAEMQRLSIPLHKIDLKFNVRSLQQAVIRYAVLGRIIL